MASVLAMGVVWNRSVVARGRPGGYYPTLKNAQDKILFFTNQSIPPLVLAQIKEKVDFLA